MICKILEDGRIMISHTDATSTLRDLVFRGEELFMGLQKAMGECQEELLKREIMDHSTHAYFNKQIMKMMELTDEWMSQFNSQNYYDIGLEGKK